jgi:hypothetical protein
MEDKIRKQRFSGTGHEEDLKEEKVDEKEDEEEEKLVAEKEK